MGKEIVAFSLELGLGWWVVESGGKGVCHCAEPGGSGHLRGRGLCRRRFRDEVAGKYCGS